MANASTNDTQSAKGPAFEWWMISNLAIGAGFSAFVALLVPPFVTETTGNAADAGVVMAIISLAAILGPVLGGFADKYRVAMYGISAEAKALYALDAIVMGASIAAVSAVAPVFIVGARLPRALEAKRLTTFNLVAPVGQVLGGVMLGAAAAAGWSFSQRFWLAAAVMFIAFLVTWFASKEPAKRIQSLEDKPDEHHEERKKSFGLGRVLFSAFGMYLLILVLSSVANNGINNQIANILPNVYGIDQTTTSGLISLAGLLNIAFFFVAGGWMARSGAMSPFTMGNVLRLVGSLGMALLGLVANAPILIVVAFMQILYQGNPFVRLTQATIAVRFATIPAGAASGWVIAASATGSFIGSILGGFLADKVGFNAINWMGAIAAGAAVVLIVISLWPAERKKRAEEVGEAASPA
jgi:MFS family permease